MTKPTFDEIIAILMDEYRRAAARAWENRSSAGYGYCSDQAKLLQDIIDRIQSACDDTEPSP